MTMPAVTEALHRYELAAAHCRSEAGKFHSRAERWGALDLASVYVASALAGLAAITALITAPTWITAGSAAASAVIGGLVRSLTPADRKALRLKLSAQWERLASSYEDAGLRSEQAGRDIFEAPGAQAAQQALQAIKETLSEEIPVAGEEEWSKTRLPAESPAPAR
ncbi:hypothetical protein [Actinoplanes sp. NPDC049599]|uniref:hypothetical protein n=1 Tax=Actinoplanes sp. NPDC049599 TaxID=3363903 RepID=UPI0037BC8DAE